MTKKDGTETGLTGAGKDDFFAGLSQELKMQMNHFSESTGQTQPGQADLSDEVNVSLFAAESSADELEDSGGVFDQESSRSAVKEPASVTTPRQATMPQIPPDAPQPPQEEGISIPASTTEERKGREMEKEEVPQMSPTEEQLQAKKEEEQASSTQKEMAETSQEQTGSNTAPPTQSVEAVVVQRSSSGLEAARASETQFSPSSPGRTLSLNNTDYTLHNILEEKEDRVVWRATCPREGQPPQPVYAVEMSIARYRQTYQHFPEFSEPTVLNQPLVHEEDGRCLLLYTVPSGYRLAEKIRDPQHHWTIQQLQQFMHALGNTIHAIHEQGHLFLQLSEERVWVQPDRKPLLHGVEQVYSSRTPYHLIPRNLGYSAPEIYHQQTPIGPYTDVFALGVLLHYMISQCPLFNHLDLSEPYIPFLRIYQLDFPVGLDHVISRACHIDTALRYASVPTFLSELDRAIGEIETRHRSPKQNLHLSVAHDIHIGINKAQRNPTNQDALFWRYDKNYHKGLFIIADGVSHCHYGSGDRASSILIASAREHWNLLVQKEIYQKPIPAPQRRRFIQSIFDTANAAISREVNRMYDRVDGYVEDVMGSTCVLAFLDGNEATISNLGDSRSYLKTPYYIEQINVDHDYKTAQLQVGCDLRTVQNLMGASLITRCVGTCRKDENLKVVPLKLQPDFFELKLQKDDILLLCSDGLSDYAGINEAESRETISKILEVHKEPISAVFWLVALANQRGGGDNISVLEIKVLDTLS